MHFSTRTADAVHILVLIALSKEPVCSREIAAGIASSPSHVLSLMSLLSKAGIIESTQGKAAGQIGLPAEKITLLSVCQAMEKGVPLLHLDTHVNEQCATGMYIQHVLLNCFDDIQKKFKEGLEDITLADLIDLYRKELQKNPLGFDLKGPSCCQAASAPGFPRPAESCKEPEAF